MRLLLVLSVLFLTACTTTHRVEAIVEEPINIPVPEVTPMTLLPVEWKVVDGQFVLTAQNYEHLALNFAEILRYLKQQKAVIQHYQQREE